LIKNFHLFYPLIVGHFPVGKLMYLYYYANKLNMKALVFERSGIENLKSAGS